VIATSGLGELRFENGYPSAEKLYDNLSCGPVITPQGGADLSSRKPDLVSNAEGSVEVFFGPLKLAGASNWIQTLPGKGWFAYFRSYGSTEPYVAKSWQLNGIEPLAPAGR
jgi:hypothetical protein